MLSKSLWLVLGLAAACTNGRSPGVDDELPEQLPANGAGASSVAGTASQATGGSSANVGGAAGTANVAGSTSGGAPINAGPTDGFVRRSGRSLVVDGKAVNLRGISFGNEVWTNKDVPWNDHNEEDFARLESWGMNVVRFCMNYATFEDDASPGNYKQTGWEWLDTNIAWAKAHKVYLLLNIHVPQGGFQPGADGNALWDVPNNQQRLLKLWQAIAERYRDERIILGFDLLNEPDVSSSPSQWQALADQLVSGIRAVNTNHLLVVERTNAVNQTYTWDGNMNWFLVKDENVMYTFHFYGPFTYTHQGADWAGRGGMYENYPDPGRMDRLDRGGNQLPRNKAYLEASLQQYAEFGARNDVPLLLGEFGAIEAAFDANRGGVQWVTDMVDVSRALGMHFIYHTYHEDNFGVFLGYGTPVDPNRANQALLNVLSTKWK